MKLSMVKPDRAEEVVPRISEYANSQNKVNAADFFANHPFHLEMEKMSRRVPAPSPGGVLRNQSGSMSGRVGSMLTPEAVCSIVRGGSMISSIQRTS